MFTVNQNNYDKIKKIIVVTLMAEERTLINYIEKWIR